MSKRLAWVGGMCLGLLVLGWGSPAHAFIERLTPLGDVIADSDFIFVAKVDAIKADPADETKKVAVLKIDKDLKGQAPFRRMPVSLVGDKEKHTPELLKRIAPELPIVVFVTKLEQQHLVLAYTNGTWLQVIGQGDDKNPSWSFTHCEIYLRRTFKGTTDEMLAVLKDALDGKKKPPEPNKNEKPGFGPKLEAKPAGGMGAASAGGGVLFGVIALPFLVPIAAILQLLFPVVVIEQWKQYRLAVAILLTQSTLVTAHWIIATWIVTDQPWWLSDSILWGSLLAVAVMGALIASIRHWRRMRGDDPVLSQAPGVIEYVLIGVLLLAGVCWAAYSLFDMGARFWSLSSCTDPMALFMAAALAGGLHLLYRKVRFAQPAGPQARKAVVTTDLVILWSLVLVGAGLGVYMFWPQTNLQAAPVVTEWPTFRGSQERTGTLKPDDPGPSNPRVLWHFEAKETKGRIRLHSSPTVLDGQVYVGALQEVSSFGLGQVYCVNALDGRVLNGVPVGVGERIWGFNSKSTLRGAFSSPSVAQGMIFIGEGYHDHSGCRLFCLDARNADRVIWAWKSQSHVESSPCIAGNRVYFGAGDDGIVCVDVTELDDAPDAPKDPPRPRLHWQVGGIHVDDCPIVVGSRLYAGSLAWGDKYTETRVVAVDIDTGKEVWRVPAPMSLTASPAYANGRVFFGMGNHKVNEKVEVPAGGMWCLDNLETQEPRRLWEFYLNGSVLGTPALMDDKLYFGATDGSFTCLRQEDGNQPVWQKKLDAPIVASPTAAAGKVYVLTTAGTLYCLDANNGGNELWKLDAGMMDEMLKGSGVKDVYSSPTLANGRIYLCIGNRLYCVGDGE